MAITFWTEPGFGSVLSIICLWQVAVFGRTQAVFVQQHVDKNEHDIFLWPKAVWTDKNKSIRVISGSYMMVSPGYIL